LRVANAPEGIKEARAVIDRHLITLAIALQDIDNDVPQLQTWDGPQAHYWQRADTSSSAAQVLVRSKLDTS
jgi:hypothetical protein